MTLARRRVTAENMTGIGTEASTAEKRRHLPYTASKSASRDTQ
jgi:hypothetical protein